MLARTENERALFERMDAEAADADRSTWMADGNRSTPLIDMSELPQWLLVREMGVRAKRERVRRESV